MSHSSLSGMNTLLEHYERARDEALQRLQRADGALGGARLQAEQLQQYRSECEQRRADQFSVGGSVLQLQLHQQFAERLHGAVDQQGRQIERLQQDRERRQAELLACELKVAAVRKLLQRRGAALQQQAERRDQKQLDERSSRAAWQRLQAEHMAAGHSADEPI